MSYGLRVRVARELFATTVLQSRIFSLLYATGFSRMVTALLARSRIRVFPRDTVVGRIGETCGQWMLIARGRVNCWFRDQVEQVVTEGGSIGEREILLNEPFRVSWKTPADVNATVVLYLSAVDWLDIVCPHMHMGHARDDRNAHLTHSRDACQVIMKYVLPRNRQPPLVASAHVSLQAEH